MRVLITGTSKGIGKAIAEKFLDEGHEVIGIDRLTTSINHENYKHYELDVRDRFHYPFLPPIEIIINNAGTQNEDDIDIRCFKFIDKDGANCKFLEEFLKKVK